MQAALGWTAEQFWHSTTFDIADAIDGYREINDPDAAKRRKHADFLKTFED